MNELDTTQEKIQKVESKIPFIILISLIGFISGVLGSALVYNFAFKDRVVTESQKPQTIIKEVTQLQDNSIVDVVENTTSSVVSIIASKDVPQYQRMFSPFDFFFSPNGRESMPQQEQLFEKQKVGGGTGFFVSSDGMIVTNRHVVADRDAEYTVITSDGVELNATILARDDMLDFAVIKVEGTEFNVVDLGNSDDIKIGQTVIAIGNSLGEFSHSVSRGIISGVQRNIVAGGGLEGAERLNNIIQTDAAINFGNSGGPLLDLEGKVVGINTAVAQGAENIGFALPINQVMRLINDVKKTGKISRPFVGVRYVAMTQEIKEELNVPYDHGILVVRGQNIVDFAVLPGSPADEAGIEEYDVILEIDGQQINADNSLSHIIANYSVGDTVTLKVWHKGEERDVSITLKDKESVQKK